MGLAVLCICFFWLLLFVFSFQFYLYLFFLICSVLSEENKDVVVVVEKLHVDSNLSFNSIYFRLLQ